MAVRAVDTAFQDFFLGLADYPRPREKFKNDSLTLADPSYLGCKRLSRQVGAIKAPKLGWMIKFSANWKKQKAKIARRTLGRRRRGRASCTTIAQGRQVPRQRQT